MNTTTFLVACISFLLGWLFCFGGVFCAYLCCVSSGTGNADRLNAVERPEKDNKLVEKAPDQLVEKTIGEKAFKVKIPEGETNVTFSAFIHVQIRAKDEKAFDKRYKECVVEIEDNINVILKASTREERMEAALTAIKEKIKREVNRVLGTPWVQGVLCTEFSYEMQ